jgi:hypothetical protein
MDGSTVTTKYGGWYDHIFGWYGAERERRGKDKHVRIFPAMLAQASGCILTRSSIWGCEEEQVGEKDEGVHDARSVALMN